MIYMPLPDDEIKTDLLCPRGHAVYERPTPQDPGALWKWCPDCGRFYFQDEVTKAEVDG